MLNVGNCLSVMYADLGLHTAHHKYTYKYGCVHVLEREESQNVVATWSIISSKGLFGRSKDRIISKIFDLRSKAVSYLISSS
jgi:hypothetical protein